MSTRGNFILRKKCTDKELKIRHDAYPDGAGLDIVELIKTVDIKVLYDNIEDYEEASFDETIFDKPDFPDGPEAFSFEKCKQAVRKNIILYGTVSNAKNFNKSGFFDEYEYRIDFDKGKLFFYRSVFIKSYCSDDNNCKNAAEDDIEKYNRCFINKLAAVFDLEYIRMADIDHIVDLMNKAVRNDNKEAFIYSAESFKQCEGIASDFDKQKYQAIATVQQIIEKLDSIKTGIPGLAIISNRRADDLLHSCVDLVKITKELENMVDLLR